ncbi:carboxylate--amine ligase [Desulfogranum mediterraneum]|uniref:carboxylate--amine ligase n=1 Tax=Desulfogranum mediterraneum TaxID=160661 RepID=UPI00041724D2|nr:ATP-grasp domain-containing protein [Desulfogranum mediterraneum]
MHSADFKAQAMSFASRYSSGHFVYPSPFVDQKKFIRCLVENIQRLGARVLIPVLEETFLISKYSHDLSQYVDMVVPSYKQILVAHNKDQWEAVARAHDIPVPLTVTAASLQEQRGKVDDLPFPVLIKPKQGGGGWGVEKIDSADGLHRLLDADGYLGLPLERFLVQEMIQGESHCVAMLFNRGALRAKVVYQQLRNFPVGFGQATMRVSVRNERAEHSFHTFLKSLEWHGVCQADFVVESRTGVPYLIDVNPRLWGGLAQALASGVDFPYLLYKIAVDGDVEPVESFTTGVYSRWLGGELRSFPALLKKEVWKLQFIREFLSPSGWDVYKDDFSVKDPAPFFVWMLHSLFEALKRKMGSSPAEDSLRGIWQ